jgi:phosphoribosylformylglycinamidine cyclo-ligase
MDELTYKKAGVDIDEGERLVSLITPLVRQTFRPEVLTDIGSFGALFSLDRSAYKHPVLVSGTDGVGTKLKVAFMADRHDTVGIDLVAMCVNDILTLGAEPLFFLDYLATGKLSAEKAREVIRGIAEGCKEAGCALIGGETAEMPSFYKQDEYDLAGFAVGVVDRDHIIDGMGIEEGDAIIGLASNGLHSNGYSLARKVFFEVHHYENNSYFDELGLSLGDELLKPTRIYVKAFNAVKNNMHIRGMAHITGGGLPGNLTRIIGNRFSAIISLDTWPVPPIFRLIQRLGNVPESDMNRTFNMGIGYVMVVPKDEASSALTVLRERGFMSYQIGVIKKAGKERIVYV